MQFPRLSYDVRTLRLHGEGRKGSWMDRWQARALTSQGRALWDMRVRHPRL